MQFKWTYFLKSKETRLLYINKINDNNLPDGYVCMRIFHSIKIYYNKYTLMKFIPSTLSSSTFPVSNREGGKGRMTWIYSHLPLNTSSQQSTQSIARSHGWIDKHNSFKKSLISTPRSKFLWLWKNENLQVILQILISQKSRVNDKHSNINKNQTQCMHFLFLKIMCEIGVVTKSSVIL